MSCLLQLYCKPCLLQLHKPTVWHSIKETQWQVHYILHSPSESLKKSIKTREGNSTCVGSTKTPHTHCVSHTCSPSKLGKEIPTAHLPCQAVSNISTHKEMQSLKNRTQPSQTNKFMCATKRPIQPLKANINAHEHKISWFLWATLHTCTKSAGLHETLHMYI